MTGRTAGDASRLRSLRVVTLNIHKGLSLFNRRMVIHDLREGLRKIDAAIAVDVLARLEGRIGRTGSYTGVHEVFPPVLAGFRGRGPRAREVCARAPRVKPGFIIANLVAQAAPDAVDVGNLGAAIGRSAEDDEHFRRPAVVAGIVREVVGHLAGDCVQVDLLRVAAYHGVGENRQAIIEAPTKDRKS